MYGSLCKLPGQVTSMLALRTCHTSACPQHSASLQLHVHGAAGQHCLATSRSLPASLPLCSRGCAHTRGATSSSRGYPSLARTCRAGRGASHRPVDSHERRSSLTKAGMMLNPHRTYLAETNLQSRLIKRLGTGKFSC